jgi:tRNA/tmRNA/rRNA uracil-C5-methylase (TrmA/RlmC/RlmD family)
MRYRPAVPATSSHGQPIPDRLTLEAERIAVGGDAIGHAPDGRVVFISGLLPGERGTVRLRGQRTRHGFADVETVLSPSPERRDPPCPHVAAGCGGCDWLHVSDDHQRQLRREIVVDAFAHNSGLTVPEIATVALPETGYRTTIRIAAGSGGAGFHARRSDRLVPVDSCLVAHPRAEQLLVEGDFGDAVEATIRVGANTGDRLVLAAPTAEGVRMPDDVLVVGRDELDAGRRAWSHEEINDHRYRISADSFFQASAVGATALMDVVSDALSGYEGTVLDAYAGVGLFSKPLVASHRIIAVERSSAATADARINLGSDARVIRTAFERWRPRQVDAAVADPARRGLGKGGVGRLLAAGPRRIVLISCDAAAAARDVRLLVERGSSVRAMTLVDQFPGTSHVELVTVLDGPAR